MSTRVAIVIACAVIGCGHPKTRAPAQAGEAGFDGLWGGEVSLDVGPAGTLELVEEGGAWSATIGATSGTVAVAGETLRGTIGASQFRVHRDGAWLVGHWIQPANVLDGMPFATPVVLQRGTDGRYRGRVEPVPATLVTYVMVNGRHAYMREPSKNLGKRVGELSVVPISNGIELRDQEGTLLSTATRTEHGLRLKFEGEDIAIDLTRRGRNDATWFYARPASSTVRLAVPRADDDWPVETPAAAGIDARALEAIAAEIAGDVPDGPNTRAMHALLVARHGKLVVEEYFAGHTADALHDLRSAAKSISTTMAGIAIDRSELALDSSLYETVGLTPDDPRKREIQLAHVLSMSTGLACDDRDSASPGNEDRMQNQKTQRDWYRYTLDLAVANPPGTPHYCSGTMNLVGAMLAASTRLWLPDLVERDFMSPLGIKRYAIPLQPDGEAYFGGGMRLRARDFAKLAQVFLDRGTWRGHRVVPEAWTRDASAAHATLQDKDDYGFGWWRRRYGDVDAFYASGNGGQIAMAIPKYDLVIVFQAGNYGAFPVWKRQLDELVPRILKAVR